MEKLRKSRKTLEQINMKRIFQGVETIDEEKLMDILFKFDESVRHLHCVSIKVDVSQWKNVWEYPVDWQSC